MTLLRKGATFAIRKNLQKLDLEILNTIYHKHLKHEKPNKYIEPFLVKKLDFEGSYAFDRRKQVENKNDYKDIL